MEVLNYLNDPQRRYKIIWMTVVDLNIGIHRYQVLTYLNERLEACEPGTTIAKIFYDPLRQAYGIVLHNPVWSSAPEDEYLPTYKPPIKPVKHQIDDQSIIDVEFSVDGPKELGNHGKAT